MSSSAVPKCFWITCLTNNLSESAPPDASKNGRIPTSEASSNVKPSANNSHTLTVIRVDIIVLSLPSSDLHSFLVTSAISATASNNSFSTFSPNLLPNRACSLSLDNISTSITSNLSNNALSNTLVEVYSVPILAVAIKDTPDATLTNGALIFSSNLKYL